MRLPAPYVQRHQEALREFVPIQNCPVVFIQGYMQNKKLLLVAELISFVTIQIKKKDCFAVNSSCFMHLKTPRS